jgi:FixJ family two-component response regulator
MASRTANARVVSIVDDDDLIRDVLCSVVRSLGLAAYGFASAEEFLRSPRPSETSCLISDVHMPSMSGLELQQALIAQGRSIPIIFVTAYPDETLKARAIKAGAICFLSKPIDEQELIKCINEANRAAGHGVSEN